MSRTRTLRKILVALDASRPSLAALEAAARLAEVTGAELEGLFVEDEALLRGAEFPRARVVGTFSGQVRPIGRGELEKQLQAQADRARRALEAVALRGRIRWSFRVSRGAVPVALCREAGHADIISVGRGRTGPRMGPTPAAILETEGAPLLLLDPDLSPGQAVVALYDGEPGSETALGLAAILGQREDTPLFVVLRGPENELTALENAAANQLRELGVEKPARFFRLGRGDAGLLARINRPGGLGLLVLPRATALGRPLGEVLTEVRCPVLVVRKPRT